MRFIILENRKLSSRTFVYKFILLLEMYNHNVTVSYLIYRSVSIKIRNRRNKKKKKENIINIINIYNFHTFNFFIQITLP